VQHVSSVRAGGKDLLKCMSVEQEMFRQRLQIVICNLLRVQNCHLNLLESLAFVSIKAMIAAMLSGNSLLLLNVILSCIPGFVLGVSVPGWVH
jgi:hypothetical protein